MDFKGIKIPLIGESCHTSQKKGSLVTSGLFEGKILPFTPDSSKKLR
jgi:hypothetical protein